MLHRLHPGGCLEMQSLRLFKFAMLTGNFKELRMKIDEWWRPLSEA
jgi:hypothetical protein